MRDNDLIRRGDVEKILCDAYDDDMIDEGKLAYLISEANKLPAVPQEMSAREFVIAHHRMCQSKMECVECRICHDDREPRSCAVLMGLNPDDTVDVVEEWAREHPEEENDG